MSTPKNQQEGIMTDEQRQRLERQIRDIFIDTKAIMDRLEMVKDILAEDDKQTLEDWQQTEPRPDDW
jgi:uncharacterized protein YecA (UPF0149 family)